MRTCTGPYRFSIVEPVYCFEDPDDCDWFDDPDELGGGEAPAGGAVVDGVPPAPDGGVVTAVGAALVWNDAIRMSPTTVARRAGRARRISNSFSSRIVRGGSASAVRRCAGCG